MAKQNTITIDGNFKSINKGFSDLSKSIKDINSKQIAVKVDDKKLRDAIKFQKDVITNTKNEIQKLTIAMNEAFDDKRVNKLRSRIDGLKKDLKEANSTLSDISPGQGGRSGGGGGMLGLGALGKAGMIGLVGAAVVGAMKFVLGPAMQAASSRLQLRGAGLSSSSVSSLEREGVALGYSPSQSRQQASAMMRATGSASQVGMLQMFSRSIGADPGDLIGMMGSMRGGGLSDKESMGALKDIFVDAVSAGFDSSRALDVMGAIASHTGEMAKRGDVSVEGIRSAMAMVMQSSPFFTQNPDRAMGALSGINNMFTGGGPASSIAFRAISNMFPNGSMTSKMYEMRKGIFKGGDSSQKINEFLSSFINIGTGGQQVRAGGGAGQLSEDQVKSLSMMLKDMGGADSDESANEIINAFLTKSGSERDSIIKSRISIQEDLQKRTVDILESSDSKLLAMGVSLEYIRLGLSDLILKTGEMMHPFSSMFSKRQTAAGPTSMLGFAQDKLGIKEITAGGKVLPVTKAMAESFNNMGSGKSINSKSLSGIGFSDSAVSRMKTYDPMIREAAQKYGVPENLMRSLILNESGFNPDAMSGTGALGLGQATQGTWNQRNPYTGIPFGEGTVSGSLGTFRTANDPRRDPKKNINFVGHYLSYLMKKSKGDPKKAIQGYIDQNDIGWHDKNIISGMNKLDSISTQGPTAAASINKNDAFMAGVGDNTMRELIKVIKEKQTKKPALKSEITDMSKVWLNHSESAN